MAIVIMNLKMYQALDFESNQTVGVDWETEEASEAAETAETAEAAEAEDSAELVAQLRARIKAAVSNTSEPARATQIIRLERFVKYVNVMKPCHEAAIP